MMAFLPIVPPGWSDTTGIRLADAVGRVSRRIEPRAQTPEDLVYVALANAGSPDCTVPSPDEKAIRLAPDDRRNTMLARLLPRETSFFDLFERHAGLTVAGTRELVSLVSTGANITAKAKRIKEIEHEADTATHQCVEALHKTFVTPIDRYDIHRLISRMDDVMDFVEAASDRISLYELREMTQDVKDLADVLARSAVEVEQAIKLLRNMKNADAIRRKCIDINRLENEGDTVLRGALAKLFKTEKDPITIIKWKEIYELLEAATDRCEDVANIIEGVVLEHG
jgi:predicted phosphate transport protein (TIGR00153 family)